MLSLDTYREWVVSQLTRLPVESSPIGSGHGRGLAEDLVARFAVPPFDNSAMDGFAVRAVDLAAGAVLRVVGDVPAGAASVPGVGPGETARIMTGAPLPPGADTVLPVELTDQPTGSVPLPTTVRVQQPVAAGSHIRRRGENTHPGDVVLRSGQRWSAACAAAAASVGYARVPLVRRPKVAVISTGSELVAPGADLGFGQIPDSNSVLLAGLVRQFGAEATWASSVDDRLESFEWALREAAGVDLIVTSGGVSVGAFEVVRRSTQGQVRFEQVAMQPGKPQAFGRVRLPGGEVPLVGLPGNPVSVFVSAWAIVRPALARLGGWRASWPSLRAVVGRGWRSPEGRQQFVPVQLSWADDGTAHALPTHRLGAGSHLVASLHLTDGLAVVPAQAREVAEGEVVTVLLTR